MNVPSGPPPPLPTARRHIELIIPLEPNLLSGNIAETLLEIAKRRYVNSIHQSFYIIDVYSLSIIDNVINSCARFNTVDFRVSLDVLVYSIEIGTRIVCEITNCYNIPLSKYSNPETYINIISSDPAQKFIVGQSLEVQVIGVKMKMGTNSIHIVAAPVASEVPKRRQRASKQKSSV